ncbi:hypothetical protein HPB50_015772 [Hyalomma asiaticum]|uniref:Uncharacterized protein n=1 Tax=Hyalomma asiaticum TaxID=266040 RepID=A0ACB7SW68_HYAAI|nr:hypothetical protein HPB50_015772 [Hyalomma asiaticum]
MSYLGLLLFLPFASCTKTPPDIIFILADDLGWDDVSFHGSSQIPTPNLDALAADGVILNSYYAQPACTPSRAALMTGLYPMRTGMEGFTIDVAEAWALPLNLRILPQYLKDLGYETHLVGKWNLGYYAESFTPTFRGFDTFYGYYNGEEDYYTHSITYWNLGYYAESFTPTFRGFDTFYGYYNGEEDYYTHSITYSAMHQPSSVKGRPLPLSWSCPKRMPVVPMSNPSLSSCEAVLRATCSDDQLWLVGRACLEMSAVHGTDIDGHLQAPQENVDKFPYIGEEERTIFAGMVDAMDQSVGEVFEALSDAGMLPNSVVAFSSDNGGAPFGAHSSRSFNWPLRGTKGTLWEGATRSAAFVWSPLLHRRRRVSNELMHITDWLPTLYSLGGMCAA